MTLNQAQIEAIELFAERRANQIVLTALIASLDAASWGKFQRTIAALRERGGTLMIERLQDLELSARCEAAFDTTMTALFAARRI